MPSLRRIWLKRREGGWIRESKCWAGVVERARNTSRHYAMLLLVDPGQFGEILMQTRMACLTSVKLICVWGTKQSVPFTLKMCTRTPVEKNDEA